MKKLLYILMTILVVVFLYGSCKKTGINANPLSDVNSLSLGSYLLLDSVVNLNLSSESINTSSVGIMVQENAGGLPVDHIVVYVAQSYTYDTTQWASVKTISYTGKNTLISITGLELANALGVDPSSISPGTSYYFYNRAVSKSGAFWDISNTGYANDGNNLIAGSNYNSAFYYVANIVCPFVAPMAGTYKVIEDDWQDWSPGDLVQVSDGPGTNQLNLSQVWPNPANGTVINPLYCSVDPLTGVATIPAGINWGNYGGTICSTLTGGGGNVFSCTGLISLKIHVSASGYGDQGILKLVLQKQ